MITKLAVAPLTVAFLLSTSPLAAQTLSSADSPLVDGRSAPAASPVVSTIPAAADIAYPGTIELAIDATDVTRELFKVSQTIPVVAGTSDLVLLIPRWLPGNHAPRGESRHSADSDRRARDFVGAKVFAHNDSREQYHPDRRFRR